LPGLAAALAHHDDFAEVGRGFIGHRDDSMTNPDLNTREKEPQLKLA